MQLRTPLPGKPRTPLALVGSLAALLLCVALLIPAVAPAKKRQRVVALTPFAANVAVKLGVKPVAIGKSLGGAKHLDRRLRGVRKLPLSHASNGPNLEQLASVDPDIVFSERTWRAGHAAIRNLDIHVAQKDPYRVAQVRKKVVQIGKMLQRRGKAKRLAKRIAKQVRRSTRKIRTRPNVLMILGVGQTPYAFLPNSWGGNLVRRAGGNLLTEGLTADGEDLLVDGGYAQLSNEEILARNPDVIIAVPHGRAADVKEIAANLRSNEYFAATNAGENGRIHVTTDNRLLQGSTDVGKTIKKVRKRFLRNR